MVPGGAWSGGVGIPACTEADPPGETAIAADGMHPTGMHSCFPSFITSNDRSFDRSSTWTLFTMVFFVHRDLNNALYNKAHLLNWKPYLGVIATYVQ